MMRLRRAGSRYPRSNAIVYFDEVLDEQYRQTIECIVERVEGVTDAHFNETQQQLMIVGFDPTLTSSDAILSRVRRRHLDAQLV